MRRALTPVLLLALAGGARAQTSLEEAVQHALPDLFAGLLGTTLAEEISGASFRVDGGAGAEDTRFRTLRLPWSAKHELASLPGVLHLEASAGLLVGQDFFEVDTPSGRATVRQDWTLAGGLVGAGWDFPLHERWVLRPGATLALAYLENDARYNEAGEVELAPLLDGILVNWDGWAVSPAANLTLERPRDPAALAVGFETRYTLARTNVFDATSEVQEGSDSSRILAARLELGAPLDQAPDGLVRSAWDVFLGGMHLSDVEREALGFDRILELGAGWSKDWPRLPPLRFSVGWIYGDDVRGYSLGVELGS